MKQRGIQSVDLNGLAKQLKKLLSNWKPSALMLAQILSVAF
jgi:hypothetical protein